MWRGSLGRVAVLALWGWAAIARADAPPCDVPASGRSLLGDPATLDGQGLRAAWAIYKAFGLDARCLKVVALESGELQKRVRAPGWRTPSSTISGFHRPGLATDATVFVEKIREAVEDQVLLHEVIHAVSGRFWRELERHHATKVDEGITEYFSTRVMVRGYRVPRASLLDVYRPYVAFAEALAELVGTPRLEAFFFHLGYRALADEIAAKRPGASLVRATRSLESNDLEDALAEIRWAPSEAAKARLTTLCNKGDSPACLLRDLSR